MYIMKTIIKIRGENFIPSLHHSLVLVPTIHTFEKNLTRQFLAFLKVDGNEKKGGREEHSASGFVWHCGDQGLF
jgi:hypothetical protein